MKKTLDNNANLRFANHESLLSNHERLAVQIMKALPSNHLYSNISSETTVSHIEQSNALHIMKICLQIIIKILDNFHPIMLKYNCYGGVSTENVISFSENARHCGIFYPDVF